MAYYDLVFTPQTQKFQYILIQLARIAEDKDIITKEVVGNSHPIKITDDGITYRVIYPQDMLNQPIFGRYIDLDAKTGSGKTVIVDGEEKPEEIEHTFKLYKLKNLNSESTGFKHSGPIKRLGI